MKKKQKKQKKKKKKQQQKKKNEVQIQNKAGSRKGFLGWVLCSPLSLSLSHFSHKIRRKIVAGKHLSFVVGFVFLQGEKKERKKKGVTITRKKKKAAFFCLQKEFI